MAILNIVTSEDEVLRKKCRPVEKITPRTLTLLDDMLDTMRAANGVGLAAPQVGILRRIVIVDIGEGLIEMINPEIVATEGEQEGEEGCLSVPDEVGIVKRPNIVTVKATDRNGEPFTIRGEGLLARAFCHEIDHLDGILYIDKASRMLTPEEMEDEE
ncbi:MAG: peptide deformylase [Clostridia bacterium]|jgi:peptide deformylase|nr:peptide deformylase [Clostridia bacterium]MBQ1255063.1 peptide deformylase [Clostridia bacterium]MBQ2254900.1 peptide deformylase [Clostridia bacterium]MBQ5791699.1 peptide deformylase [Clostridia bacterium]